MDHIETDESSQGYYVKMRCACCGTRSFGKGSFTIELDVRRHGVSLHEPRNGALCERCFVAFHERPKLREGIRLAVLAGMCLADLMHPPASGVH